MLPESPQITSFIIRFVHSEGTGNEQPIRGTVRHILSHQEVNFTNWREAVRFMNQYVPLEAGLTPETDPHAGID